MIRVTMTASAEPPFCTVKRGDRTLPLYWHEFVKHDDGSYRHPLALEPGDVLCHGVAATDATASVRIGDNRRRGRAPVEEA